MVGTLRGDQAVEPASRADQERSIEGPQGGSWLVAAYAGL